MSLCKLPDSNYTYLSIVCSNGCATYWNANTGKQDSPQFWIDREIDTKYYQPAVWWKFWKKTTSFKVFACGGTVVPFYKTILVQEK